MRQTTLFGGILLDENKTKVKSRDTESLTSTDPVKDEEDQGAVASEVTEVKKSESRTVEVKSDKPEQKKLSEKKRSKLSLTKESLPKKKDISHVKKCNELIKPDMSSQKGTSKECIEETEFQKCQKTISYADFLGLITSECTDVGDSEHYSTIMDTPSLKPEQTDSKTRSITSYFTKDSDSPFTKVLQIKEQSTMTVTAEIHTSIVPLKEPSINKVKSTNDLKYMRKERANNAHSDNDFIEILSSETILGEGAHSAKAESKKRKYSFDHHSHDGTSVTTLKKVKSAVEQNVNENSKKDCSQAEHITSVSSTKTTQSKLCFGNSSLSLIREQIPDGEKVSNGRKGISTEAMEVQEKSKGRNSKENSIVKNSETAKSNLNSACSTDHPGGEKQEVSVSSTRSKESIAEIQVDKSKEITQELDKCNEVQPGVENTAVQNGPFLRRSARLIRPVQTKPKDEDVEVMVCSDDEDDKKQAKSKSSRKKTEKFSLTSSKDRKCGKDTSPSQKVSKHAGKLAPIFTKIKSDVEEEVKVISLQEDSEKARLRREFLMSGVPDELKKLIASNAAQAIVLDYPPFPSPSHVQQACSHSSSLHSVETLLDPRLFEVDRSEDEYLPLSPLPWNSLCDLTEDYRAISKQFQFEDFTSHPSLTETQIDAALTALQSFDPKFPFREVYKSIRFKQLNGDLQGEKSNPRGSQDKGSMDCNEVIIIDELSPPQVKDLTSVTNVDVTSSLWPDVYQPCSASEVIGNGKVIKHLKSWLEEWKAIMLKDARKASKGKKTNRKQKEKDGSWSDDSDFTHSESEDEEDTSLCNTMLITGPHGVGKTSTVYALAKELGYKVFEVSSSSLRSGKQLLFHLEEATQSHRVAQSHCFSALSTPLPGSKDKPETKSKPVSKASSAFANLFNVPKHTVKVTEKNKNIDKGSEKEKAGYSTRRKKDKDVKAKRQREMPEADGYEKDNSKKTSVGTPEEGTALGSLNLASSSLILFDEVDIVFEEDRGFLATVQHFMMSTKIPIILTSSESSFSSQLTARHEHILFRPPPVSAAANFIQMVCLAHGVRTCQKALCNILRLLNCDIRRCLLALQFWVESGGGRIQVSQEMTVGHELLQALDGEKGENTASRPLVQSEDSNDAQFLCLQPGKKRPRKMVFEDEDSDYSNSESNKEFEDLQSCHVSSKSRNSQLETHHSGCLKITKRKTENDGNMKVTRNTADKQATLPVLHLACEESILGLQNCSISVSTLVDYIQGNVMSAKDFKEACNICTALSQVLPWPALYSCTLKALPLAKCPIPPVSHTVHCKVPQRSGNKKRRRIYMEDFFDSDGSDSEVDKSKRGDEICASSVSEKEQNVNKGSILVEKNLLTFKCVKPESFNISEENISSSMFCRKHSKLAGPMLSEFAKYYDANSFLDTLENINQSGKRDTCLRPGLSDEVASYLTDNDGLGTMPEVGEAVNILASRQFYSGVASCLSKYQNEEMDGSTLPEEFHLPISEKEPDLWTLANKRQFERDPLVKSVCASLGPLSKCSEPSVHMDYLPVLRDICRQEKDRQASNTKRRFHHYLDHIGLGLKESVICRLATTFTVVCE